MPFLLRDQIRQRVEKRVEALGKGYRQNIALLGRPALGKTRLLATFFNQFSGQPSLVTVYVDAHVNRYEELAERWSAALLAGVFSSQSITPPKHFQSLLLAADPIIPKTTDKIRNLKKMIRRQEYSVSVRELFSLTGMLAEETGKKVILMIDEFQALQNLPVTDPFAALGREIMIEKNTLYFVTSSSSARAHEIFRDKLSLLFGNFEVMSLEPFGIQETIQFLEERFPERKLSYAQKKFFVRMTNGHPVYLELLTDQLESCLRIAAETHFAFRDHATGVAPYWICEAFHRELCHPQGRISLIFQQRVESCRRLARDGGIFLGVLLAISNGRRKETTIASAIERKVGETKKILQRLVQEGIVERHGSFYVLEDLLFRFWLREVYGRRRQLYTPDQNQLNQNVADTLRREFEKSLAEDTVDIAANVEALFKEFRNDVVEIDQKKIQCPQFSEVIVHPAHGAIFSVYARNAKTRWGCQVAGQSVCEEDIANFLDEIKRLKKKLQRKVMIALGGIDQNAKLMAQEARIHIWDLQSFNALLDLYDLPRIILLSDKEENGSTLGAMAQSVHSA